LPGATSATAPATASAAISSSTKAAVDLDRAYLGAVQRRRDHLQRAGILRGRAFGIRIENLLVATAVPLASEDERRFLAFETLTAVPIDLALVEASETRVAHDFMRSAWLSS
jgi:hypothetical protein